jgi:ubiquinone/menaquinone biosynthesis C-methylase UbiE
MRIRLFIVPFLICQVSQAQNSLPVRDQWQKPELIMDSLEIKTGMTIGEIGAGGGYFTVKLARRVGKTGIIYANDIKKNFISEMNRRSRNEGLDNIRAILGKEDHPMFPDSTLDMAVMVYVFHDLTQPVALMKKIKPALKKGALVCIVDRDPDRFPGDEGDRNHFMKKELLIRKVIEAGYTIIKVFTFLPRDNIYVCSPESLEPL